MPPSLPALAIGDVLHEALFTNGVRLARINLFGSFFAECIRGRAGAEVVTALGTPESECCASLGCSPVSGSWPSGSDGHSNKLVPIKITIQLCTERACHERTAIQHW